MAEQAPEAQKHYPRFRIGARIEHFILMVSFTVLVVTGIPQKYAELEFVGNAINAVGGLATLRDIHRVMAFLLIAGTVYHILTASYRFFVKRERMSMIPDLKDAADLKQTIAYNLGFEDEPPRMRKFNFGEKFEYWAVVWGTAVMILTGFMLMNPIATTRLLPGEAIPVALAAHGNEALLAALAIIIWHMYNVHIKHFNPSMFTGRLPRHMMEEEHALELERLERGGKPWPELDLPTLYRRRRIYVVVSVIVGAIALGVLIWAFTFEETAIITVTRATQEVFVPLATGTPLP